MLVAGGQNPSIDVVIGASGEAEGPALVGPAEWQGADVREPGGCEVGGLATTKDGGGDVGSQVGQPDDAGEIGVGDAHRVRTCFHAVVMAGLQFTSHCMGTGDESDERVVKLRGCFGSLGDQPHRQASPAELGIDAEDDGGLVIRTGVGVSAAAKQMLSKCARLDSDLDAGVDDHQRRYRR